MHKVSRVVAIVESELTVHHQVVGDPAGSLQSRVPHQTVQSHPVHTPQGVQGEVGGHGPALGAAVLRLTREIRIPGQSRWRTGHGAAGGSYAEGLALLQNHRVQRRDW